MISVIQTPADELIDEVDGYPVPAGDCGMELDWQCVAGAFAGAAKERGWAVDVRVRPERRYEENRRPAGDRQRVGARPPRVRAGCSAPRPLNFARRYVTLTLNENAHDLGDSR